MVQNKDVHMKNTKCTWLSYIHTFISLNINKFAMMYSRYLQKRKARKTKLKKTNF